MRTPCARSSGARMPQAAGDPGRATRLRERHRDAQGWPIGAARPRVRRIRKPFADAGEPRRILAKDPHMKDCCIRLACRPDHAFDLDTARSSPRLSIRARPATPGAQRFAVAADNFAPVTWRPAPKDPAAPSVQPLDRPAGFGHDLRLGRTDGRSLSDPVIPDRLIKAVMLCRDRALLTFRDGWLSGRGSPDLLASRWPTHTHLLMRSIY
jgi:hypothetical protein